MILTDRPNGESPHGGGGANWTGIPKAPSGPGGASRIRGGKIRCRVYRKAKFHAKAYITHAWLKVLKAWMELA